MTTLIPSALIPALAVAIGTRSVWIGLGVVAVVVAHVLAPRLASPAFQAGGVPSGRMSAFALWRHQRRVLAEDRAKGRKLR